MTANRLTVSTAERLPKKKNPFNTYIELYRKKSEWGNTKWYIEK